MSHTPGPWVRYGYSIETADGAKHIAVVTRREEGDSNGALLAAAPELLAALKAARHCILFERMPEDWGIAKIDQIITKAIGDHP